MDNQQEKEWSEAQNIVISQDLLGSAKQQLLFLAHVDRNRWLYTAPALQTSIYRYNACWLPLLAKNLESRISEGPLVVPLDCEWVWHCHRLNPVRYKSDCEKFYGRIFDNCNVVSSVQGVSEKETKEIWERMYPDEPYGFDPNTSCRDERSEKIAEAEKHTTYDLVLASERQRPFFYELHAVSYCNDLIKLIGKVLEHDDTDSDRTKGNKLDVGFSETTSQWEQIFGSRYWRAGSMYRGTPPSPLITTPFVSTKRTTTVVLPDEQQKIIHLPESKSVEVMLEFVEIKNLPEGLKGSVYVLFSKTQPDVLFSVKRKLSIHSESGEKNVALFYCQPNGHLLFEVFIHSKSNRRISKPKALGSTAISLEYFFNPVCSLSLDKWLELVPPSGVVNSNPICIRAAISIIPSPATRILRLVQWRPFLKKFCFSPFLGRVQFARSWKHVIDETGNELISLQMRDISKLREPVDLYPRKEVIGITESGEMHNLAKLEGTEWSLVVSSWSVLIPANADIGIHYFELIGHRTVRYYPGRKLEYQPKHWEKGRSDRNFLTAVEFSADDPYGRAVALLDFKKGTLNVQEDWLALPSIILGFIISETFRKEGYNGLTNFVGGKLKS